MKLSDVQTEIQDSVASITQVCVAIQQETPFDISFGLSGHEYPMFLVSLSDGGELVARECIFIQSDNALLRLRQTHEYLVNVLMARKILPTKPEVLTNRPMLCLDTRPALTPITVKAVSV